MNLRAIKRRHDKATTRVAIFRFGSLSVLARFKTADGRTWGFASRITKELFHDAPALKSWLEQASGCPEPAVLHVAWLKSVGTSYALRVFERGAYWTPMGSFLAPLPHEVRR
jgi:hypothetical protein